MIVKSSFLLYFFKNIAINMKIFDSQQRAKSVFSLVYNMVVYSCFGILIRWNNIDLEDWTTASLSCGPAYVKKAQWGNILSRFDDNIFMDWPLANLPRSDPTKMQYYVASITNRKNNIKIKETFFFTQEDINKTKISFQKWVLPHCGLDPSNILTSKEWEDWRGKRSLLNPMGDNSLIF